MSVGVWDVGHGMELGRHCYTMCSERITALNLRRDLKTYGFEKIIMLLTMIAIIHSPIYEQSFCIVYLHTSKCFFCENSD